MAWYFILTNQNSTPFSLVCQEVSCSYLNCCKSSILQLSVRQTWCRWISVRLSSRNNCRSWSFLRFYPRRRTTNDRDLFLSLVRIFFFRIPSSWHTPVAWKNGIRISQAFLLHPEKWKKLRVSLDDPECLSFTEIPEAIYGRYEYINVKPNAKIEEVSLFEATRNIEESTEQQRIEELFSYFWNTGNVGNTDDKGDAPFSSYKTPLNAQRFSENLQKAAKANADEFKSFQVQLAKWYQSGFPRYLKEFKFMKGRDDGLDHPCETNSVSWRLRKRKARAPIWVQKTQKSGLLLGPEKAWLKQNAFYQHFAIALHSSF